MERIRCSCCGFLLLFTCFVQVRASGKLTILLVDYSNPSHKVFNGECCDNINFCSLNECDNYFRFCASLLGASEQCSLGGLLSTKILGEDKFRFPGRGQSLGGGLINPITYSFEKWKGVSVVIEVWDDDGKNIIGKLNDFVDKYNLVVTDKPAKDKQSSTAVSQSLCGKRSCTKVQIEVYCDNKYLIPECTEYCVPRDSDVEGHYWCDYGLGRKVCLQGWYDVDSNCTKRKKECTPRNDTAGHYDCNPESGEKMCHSGWMGSNCTVVYVPTSMRLPMATSTSDAHTQTDHTQQSPSKILTASSTIYTADHTLHTVGTSMTSLSQNQEKSSVNDVYTSAPMQSPSTITGAPITASPSTPYLNKHPSAMTEILPSSVAMTTVQNSPTSTKEVVDKPTGRSTTATVTLATVDQEIMTPSSSSAHASLIEPTMTRPTTDWNQAVVINVSPKRKWTHEKEEILKNAIKEQLDMFCKNQPQSCNIDPKITLNSTSIFNTTDVLLDVRNESTGDRVSVSVRVKTPNTIPGLSGGILVPSITVKRVIMESKDTIQQQTGLKVSLHPKQATSVTMTTTPTKPRTTDTAVIETKPNDSLIPGLDDYWAFVIGVALATALLLTITLCFTYHVNRPKVKVHPLAVLPRTATRALTREEHPEAISLTTVQLFKTNKNLEKVRTSDVTVRSRSRSTDLDDTILSPFTPDYTNTRHHEAAFI